MKFKFWIVAKTVFSKMELREKDYPKMKSKEDEFWKWLFGEFDEGQLPDIDENRSRYIVGRYALTKDSKSQYSKILSNSKEEIERLKDLIIKKYKILKNSFKGNIEQTYHSLKYFVDFSDNINEYDRTAILSLDKEYHINNILMENEKEITDEKKQLCMIFKALIYSTKYGEKREKTDVFLNYRYNSLESNYVEIGNTLNILKKGLSENRKIYLSGIRGSGKSELVKKFLENGRLSGNEGIIHNPVVYISYYDNLDLAVNMMNISSGLNKGTDIIKNLSEDCTLIVDNVSEHMTDEWVSILENSTCNIIIIASIKKKYSFIKQYIDMPQLSQKEAVDIFEKNIDTDRVNFEKEQKIEIAYSLLKGHPLAITVYAKAISDGCLDYDEVIDILRKSTVAKDISEEVELDKDYRVSEATAREHIMRLFEETMDNSNDENKNVMRVLSLIPNDIGIDLKRLKRYTGTHNGNAVNNNLVPRGWVKDESGNYFMHSIIQDIVIDKFKPDNKNCELFIKEIRNDVIKNQYSINSESALLISYIRSAYKSLLFNQHGDVSEITDSFIYIISFLLGVGAENVAGGLYEKFEKYLQYLKEDNYEEYLLNVEQYKFFFNILYVDNNITSYFAVFDKLIAEVEENFKRGNDTCIIQRYSELNLLYVFCLKIVELSVKNSYSCCLNYLNFAQNIVGATKWFKGFSIVMDMQTEELIITVPENKSYSEYLFLSNFVLTYYEYFDHIDFRGNVGTLESIFDFFDNIGLTSIYFLVLNKYYEICIKENKIEKIKERARLFIHNYGSELKNLSKNNEFKDCINILLKYGKYENDVLKLIEELKINNLMIESKH